MKITSVGDLGDILYLLNLIRQIPGGPHTLILRPSGSTKAKTPALVETMFRVLEPLVNAQPYIGDFVIGTGATEVEWASEDFRNRHFTPGETLMQAHLNHLIKTHGIGHDFTSREVWLHGVEPDTRSNGRVVVNLTDRYLNPTFGWQQVKDHYGERLLFVGLPHEHAAFEHNHGPIEHQRTTDMLEVARLIAGSELFIGNQSCAYACAEGLKHRSIQETSLELPDCIYGRANALFCGLGDCVLPDIAGSGEHQMRYQPEIVNSGRVPPGGWQYPGLSSQMHIMAQVSAVRQMEVDRDLTREQAEAAILQFNANRVPSFFAETHLDSNNSKYRLAMQSAGF